MVRIKGLSQCTHSMPCWVTVLMGTNRIVGREAASQMTVLQIPTEVIPRRQFKVGI